MNDLLYITGGVSAESGIPTLGVLMDFGQWVVLTIPPGNSNEEICMKIILESSFYGILKDSYL